jgi:hypothetical protein
MGIKIGFQNSVSLKRFLRQVLKKLVGLEQKIEVARFFSWVCTSCTYIQAYLGHVLANTLLRNI